MPFTPTKHATLTLCLAGLLAGAAAPVRAELGGTVSLQSDARDRGLSYSRDRPQAQLTLAWDGSTGWYAGGLLSRARFDAQRGSGFVQAYAGRVVELAPGLGLEAGLQYTRFPSISRYDFGEAYAGLIGDRWAARLHYADDYYGNGHRSVYGELNLDWPLRGTLTALAHAGVLAGRSDALYDSGRGDARIDTRLGLAWRVQALELQLSWSSVSAGGPYTWVSESHRQTVVLGVSASF